MRLRDLFARDVAGALLGSPEMDPLTEKDALQEARLNEVIFDACTGAWACSSIFAVRCSCDWHIRGCSS
jgi:hypothetical protein